MLKVINSGEAVYSYWRLVQFYLIAGSVFLSAFLDDRSRSLLFVVLLILVVLLIINKLEDRILKSILFLALFLRLVIAVIQAAGIVDFTGGIVEDSYIFEAYGWQVARAWLSGEPSPELQPAYTYYSGLIGVIYYLFGRFPLVVQSLNVIIGLLIVAYTFKITSLMSNSMQASYIASFITACFPTFIYFSALIYRENFLILFSMLSFYFFLRWLKDGGFFFIVGSFMSSLAMGFLHGAMLLVNWIQYPFYVVYKPEEKKFKFSIKQTVVLCLLLLLLIVVLAEDIIQYKVPLNFVEMVSLETFQKNVVDRQFGRTQYLDGFVPNNYFDILWHTPVRALYFMFTPFPWMIKTWQDFFGFLEVLFYLVLIYYSFIGAVTIYRENKLPVICSVIIIGSIIFLFAWGTVNYGTAWRHKAKTAPFLITLASTGIVLNSRWSSFIINSSRGQMKITECEVD